jgi:hypothetical protein
MKTRRTRWEHRQVASEEMGWKTIFVLSSRPIRVNRPHSIASILERDGFATRFLRFTREIHASRLESEIRQI